MIHMDKKSRLQGLHNYDILSNPFYQDKFLYIDYDESTSISIIISYF